MLRKLAAFAVALYGCLIAGCGETTPAGPSDVLTGQVTAKGHPVANVTVTAIGADKQAKGMTDGTGVYRIENPPKGVLKFQIGSRVPPPPPGTPAPPPSPEMASVPVKYTKPGNDLSFEYTGGSQKYDLNLKP